MVIHRGSACWCLLVALWLLLFAANSVQAEICPSIVSSTRAHTTRKYVIIQMSIFLRKGSPYVNNGAIKVSLPQGVSPVVSTRISSSQKGGSRTISSSADGLNVYFTGLHFRKSIKLIVKVGRRLVVAGRRAAFQRRIAQITGETVGLHAPEHPNLQHAFLPARRKGQRRVFGFRHPQCKNAKWFICGMTVKHFVAFI